jgi:hypothetical protein
VILLSALILGLLAGWGVAHRQRRPYRAPELRYLWLIPAAFAPQLLAVYLPMASAFLPAPVAAVILPLSLVIFLAFVWLNRRIPGMPLLMVGLLLNLAVIALNGGWMPISPETASQLPGGSALEAAVPGTPVDDKDILLRPEDTRLGFLSDRFLLPEWIGYRAAFSLGDMFVAAGAFWLLASAPRAVDKNRSSHVSA